MYIFKNAFTSIVRNKGRNILIGIIILVISCAAAVTLAIHNSADSLIESYKNKYDVEVTFGMNRDNMMGNFNPEERESSKENMMEMFESANNISVGDIEKYADSEYVKDYSYTMNVGVNVTDLEVVSVTDDTGSFEEGMGGPGGKTRGGNFQSSGDFTLIGYSSYETMNEFVEGKYKITEGEVFDDFTSNSCLINNELATLNELSVGDEITVVDSENENNTYELVVAGIYEEETFDDSRMNMFSNSSNTIITNTTMVTKIKDTNDELRVSINPTFVLTNADVVDKFEEELREKDLSEYLIVNTNLDQVEQSTSAISNVATFAITFLIITLIIGIVVLLFINMINIRERKYEIGVLRTIGMKKSMVALQFMSELVVVSFVALLLGAAVGSVASVPVANHLLENEIEESQNQSNDIRQNFGGGEMNGRGPGDKFNGVAPVQEITSIDAVVDVKVLGELLVIGIIITLISGVSAMISIQRFSPLTILKERS